MNSAKVEVPAGLEPAPARVSVEVADGSADVLSANADAFDDALVAAGKRFASRARASAPGDAAQQAAVAAGLLDEMDVPALSLYQHGALRVEEELSVPEAFASGMGAEAWAYLRRLGRKATVVDVPSGARATVTVRVSGAPGAAAAASVDVIARRGSSLSLVLALDGEADGAADGAAGGAAPGLVGAALRVFAGQESRVAVTTVQTADDAFVALDDTGLFLDEGARVEVSHTVLGAGAAYTGLAADLRGDGARIDIATSYLGARDQERDFNYEIRHFGRRTVSNMDANGVLAGSSKKVLRGTIDLMHGAHGAEGAERETVLLADEGVTNKTVPVILCDEDDVAGNHGATIGHVRPEQLFYLGCRGLSKEAAEDLFIAAKLEDAALSAPDEATRASVVRLGEAVVPHFKEEIA
ncbi:MAG: SufD family Fe-S cluster assembly protein [Coriobacteriaceae bacterium]|nr:SufD family Fe-S cluster assembly protein [Coriobacteriaceae bacterium]